MTTFPPDPYDRPPSWWRRHADWTWAAGVFALTVILTVTSFPPYAAPEFAFAFAAPAIFWAYSRPPFKLYLGTMLAAQAVAWILILGWLRHVTWIGLFLLGPLVGAWVGVWYLAVWWAMPRIVHRPTPVRLAAQLGLAALWVLIEWSRTWFLGGFPWLPLAASQWKTASILQIAAYTGAGGISFVLIMMNVGFAAYLHRMLREGRVGFDRRSQEFWLALFVLLACVCVLIVDTYDRGRYERPFARVAFVQPDIPQAVKWDPARGPGIVRILERSAAEAGMQAPDVVLWPESCAPWPVKGDPTMRALVEEMAEEARAPMIFGSDAVEKTPAGERWHNAAFVVDPATGLQPAYYAKRKLVPFGEYVPFRPLLGWLNKIEPLGDDDTPGTDPAPLLVNLREGAENFGVLICYEDIFPGLARGSVLAGSDVLAVITNDAWYGEGGAAYQHAAHSVLRAVEMRRPVLRCGNGGWSGWIDEYGYVRAELTDASGSVYFRGVRTVDVSRDDRWAGRLSFYAQHGDWFVPVCAALAGFAFLLLMSGEPAKAKRP